MAQPYIDTAAGYFSPQGAQAFLNPYASNVMAGLKDIFGQQQAQTTGQLTQAAGGIGADRIAVGQAELARQQGLTAGQTLSNMYGQAVQQAQGAGYGTAALGSQAQNAALQGTQALLGAGGLQQQLAQAQLNAPYQQQLAQAAFPYQQAQFLAGITGSLAPGLGGTTTGQGTTTTPGPSLLSQILGAGTAGVGMLGGTGAFGNSGWLTGGKGSGSGGNYATQPLTGQDLALNQSLFPGYGRARGGSVNPYDIDLTRQPDGSYADGGEVLDNSPIDIAPKDIIPTGQLPAIQPHIPQLNLSPPQQSGGSGGGGGGIGDLVKAGISLAAMFKRGGAVDLKKFDGYNPYSMHEHRFPQGYADGGSPTDTDFASLTRGDPAWRNPDIGSGYAMPPEPAPNSFAGRFGDLPAAGRTDVDFLRQYQTAMGPREGYDPRIEKAIAENTVPTPLPRPVAADDTEAETPQVTPAGLGNAAPNPYTKLMQTLAGPDTQAAAPAPAAAAPRREAGFIGSPWAALTAAGLGMMAGTSPYAGVNIGRGAMEGLKTLESQREQGMKEENADLAAKRLEQEARHHEEQFSRMTAYQRANLLMAGHKEALEAAKPFRIGTDKNGFDIMGVRDPEHPGRFLNAATGEPVAASDVEKPTKTGPSAPTMEAAAKAGVLNANAQLVAAGPYDYTEDAPYIEKGMDVPPPEPVAGRSARSLQTDAESYLQTGKLPTVRGGKSPVAVAQQKYRNAVQNYGGALAQSRGLTPEQTAEAWRTAPGMLRFVLGADGRSTVALGTAVRHLDTMQQLSNAWKAGDVATINRLRATISREFGAEAATNVEAAARIVGPEIIKAIGVAGAGTAEERGGAQQAFSTARSPEQIAGAIRTTQALLAGQLEGKKRQAMNAGVSEERFKSLIGDRPYEILSHGEAATVAPKVGERRQFRQGWGVWNGKSWVPANG